MRIQWPRLHEGETAGGGNWRDSGKVYRDADFFFFMMAFRIASRRLGFRVISARELRLTSAGLTTDGSSGRPAIWMSEGMRESSGMSAELLFIELY